MVNRRCWAVLTVAAGVVGCQGAPPSSEHTGEHTSYLLLDKEARAAGFTIEGTKAKEGPVMPVEVEPSTPIELVSPGRRFTVTPQENELVHVRGPRADLEFKELGREVDLDRLRISGSGDAARELAAVLAGEMDQRPDGSWELRSTGALGEASRVRTPLGLLEVLPVEPAPAVAVQDGPAAGGVARVGGGTARLPGVAGALSYDTAGDAAGERLINVESSLPPAVSCADPVAGVWMSHQYDARYNDWYIFTMHVRHGGAQGALVGEITSESWLGGLVDKDPPVCGEDQTNHWTLRMTAEGSADGGKLSFGGTSWRLDRLHCGRAPSMGEYNLDQFSGVVVADGKQFAAVNNDGGRMVNSAVSFRRVACR